MAQRFGGKFSPQPQDRSATGENRPPAPPPAPSAKPSRDQRRARLLSFTALAFLIPAFWGDAQQLVLSLAAGGTLLAAGWMTREGLRAAEAFDARKVARRPALPRKILGAVLTGGAMFLGGLAQYPGDLATLPVTNPALLALAGVALHLLAFGLDPLRDKGATGIDSFQTDRVARAVDEGEAHLAAMKDAILRAGDRALETRVARFADTARQLFRTVEADPGDLTAARKFLSVYLMGARDATVKFADLYAQNRSTQARADYEALLNDLETTFASRTTALLAGGHTDLDVEISVLRDRLKLET